PPSSPRFPYTTLFRSQVGKPAELVAAPVSPFVADFVGGNVLNGRARRLPGDLTEVQLDDGTRLVSTDRATGDVAVVVYPWEIARSEEHTSELQSLRHL